jgi:uncharacterized protein
MNILIAGGTGFVGTHLTARLQNNDNQIYILTRNPDKYEETNQVRYIRWLHDEDQPLAHLPTIDAVINLAGDTLFGYWTKSKKDRIYQSRINATYELIELMRQMPVKPNVFINASAIGYYGTSQSLEFTERSPDKGNDFLAEVTEAWEKTALEATSMDIRTVLARFGVIFGEDGALPLMAKPFQYYIGGRIGNGEQWVSWVHIDDVVGLIQFALTEQIKGPLNVTAPHPVTNRQLSEQLANVLHRPNYLPVPSFAIKTLLGEMSILITAGQKVLPEKAMQHHYSFNYTNVHDALRSIFR